MTGKDARNSSSKHSPWKTRISLIIGVIAVIAICAIARFFAGTGAASAQSPAQNRTQQTVAANTQANRPTAPASVSRPARPRTPAAPTRTATTNGRAAATSQLKVVAHVNNQQITREQLASACLKRYGDEVIDSIINKHIVWQACQQNGINITEADVDAEIARMSGKFGLTPDRWMQMLQDERDITPQEYRSEIIWLTLALKRLAADQIEVTDQEVKNAVEAEYGSKIKARIIAVETAQQAEQVRALAVAKPETFGALAKEHSVDPSSSVQGVIPPIRKHIGDSAYASFEQMAFSLQEGQISPIVPLGDKFVIIKCEKILQPNYLSNTVRQKAQVQIRHTLEEQKLRSSAAKTFSRLQENSKIVNVYNNAQLRQQMPGVAATINGQQVTVAALADECLKRYGKSVLDSEINRVMLLQALQRKQRSVTQADIDEELARAAEMYGYMKDGQPDVNAWVQAITEQDKVTVDAYIQDAVWPSVALKKLVDAQVAVAADDIQRGFESNYGPRVQVKAIVLNSQRTANQVWAEARRDASSYAFGELASKYSIEPISKENSGQVPPIRRHSGQPIIEDAAFQLGPGDVESLSDVLVVGDKYIILKYLGHTDPVVTEMDEEIRKELYKDLYEKKLRIAMGQEFDRLKQSASVHNFLANTSQMAKPQKSEALFRGNAAAAAPATRR